MRSPANGFIRFLQDSACSTEAENRIDLLSTDTEPPVLGLLEKAVSCNDQGVFIISLAGREVGMARRVAVWEGRQSVRAASILSAHPAVRLRIQSVVLST